MKTFILFDIDGTLLDSDSVDSRCFADSYAAVFGAPFPTIDWRQYPHVTDHVIFRTVFVRHFGREATPEERQRFEDHYVGMLIDKRRTTPGQFREVPGAVACWAALHTDDRYVLGIATGGWCAPAQVKLAHVGIQPVPPYSAYADGMEQREHILAQAINLAKADHAIRSVVYVGDAVWDVHTTRNLQLPLIGIRHRGDHEVLRREGVRHVLSGYEDRAAFLSAVELLSRG
jgi:phosphoglycolate phosphatase-like HAD superfamily hydrolase